MKNLFNIKDEAERVLILKVCQGVFSVFDIDFNIDEIRSPSRESRLVFARALICYYLRVRGFTYFDIAIILNKKSHATIMNLMNYGEKKQAVDFRWELITGKLKNDVTDMEIKNKIKWHQEEIVKLKHKLIV